MRPRLAALLVLSLVLVSAFAVWRLPEAHANGGFSNGVHFIGNFGAATGTVSVNTNELIFIQVGHSGCGSSTSTPTDTLGNTYISIGTATAGCQNKGTDYFYVKSTGTSASDVVTVSNTNNWDAEVAVFTGTTGVIGQKVLQAFAVGSGNIQDIIAVSANAYIIGTSYANCVDSVAGMTRDFSWTSGGNFGNGQSLSVQETAASSYAFTFPDSCGDQGTWSLFEFTATFTVGDYTLSNDGGPGVLQVGTVGVVVVTLTQVSGTSTVTLSCVSPPAGISCTFATNPVTLNSGNTPLKVLMNLAVANNVAQGVYTLSVTASPLGASTVPTSFTVRVTGALGAAALGILFFVVVAAVVGFVIYKRDGKGGRRRGR